MLPAPLAVTASPPTAGATLGVSRSSDENTHLSDITSTSRQRLIPSPQSGESPISPYDQPSSGQQPSYSFEGQSGSNASTPVQRHPTSNPFRNSFPILNYEDNAQPWLATEPEDPNSLATPRPRGVSLADNGPVPGPDGVRRVSRAPGRRPTSQQPPQNRYSRSSVYSNLPPGAAPPQPNFGGSG
jgi:chitin synthase